MQQTARPGRPQRGAERLSDRLQVFMSAAMRQELQDLSDRCGYSSVSDLARDLFAAATGHRGGSKDTSPASTTSLQPRAGDLD